MSDSDTESVAEQSDGEEEVQQPESTPQDDELSGADESESEIDHDEHIIKTIRPDVTATAPEAPEAELTGESEDDSSDISDESSDDEQPELDKLTTTHADESSCRIPPGCCVRRGCLCAGNDSDKPKRERRDR